LNEDYNCLNIYVEDIDQNYMRGLGVID